MLCVRTLSPSICSMSLSSVGIQLGARWQFWKKTHLPRSMASFIMLSAMGPWREKKGGAKIGQSEDKGEDKINNVWGYKCCLL